MRNEQAQKYQWSPKIDTVEINSVNIDKELHLIDVSLT